MPGTSDDININEPLEADDEADDHNDNKGSGGDARREDDDNVRARTLSSRTDQLMDTFRDYISSMEVVGGVDGEVGTGGGEGGVEVGVGVGGGRGGASMGGGGDDDLEHGEWR